MWADAPMVSRGFGWGRGWVWMEWGEACMDRTPVGLEAGRRRYSPHHPRACPGGPCLPRNRPCGALKGGRGRLREREASTVLCPHAAAAGGVWTPAGALGRCRRHALGVG